jgi:alanine racemase
MNRRLLVDLNALKANYRLMQGKVKPARCAAVIKAGAYGLGANRVACALSDAGCDCFFVATAEEALELCSYVSGADLYVLEGIDAQSVHDLRNARIIPVLNTYVQVELWAKSCAGGQPNRCILHLDSGMNRLGFDEAAVRKLAANPRLLGRLNVDYLMTHLACADEAAHEQNPLQLRRFEQLRAHLPPCRISIANSAGIFLGTEYHGDLVRPGIALYGGNPKSVGPNPMHEVVRACGRIVQVREIHRASTVGYGASAIVHPNTRLATVAFGYADGYLRCFGNRAQAVVNGHKVPVIGRVSMDSLTLNVSDVPPNLAGEGDWATLIGGGINIDELAVLGNTISYEILTGIGPRVSREYQ